MDRLEKIPDKQGLFVPEVVLVEANRTRLKVWEIQCLVAGEVRWRLHFVASLKVRAEATEAGPRKLERLAVLGRRAPSVCEVADLSDVPILYEFPENCINSIIITVIAK